jgi:hypothetical protein
VGYCLCIRLESLPGYNVSGMSFRDFTQFLQVTIGIATSNSPYAFCKSLLTYSLTYLLTFTFTFPSYSKYATFVVEVVSLNNPGLRP